MGLIYFISFWGIAALCAVIWLGIQVHKENKSI